MTSYVYLSLVVWSIWTCCFASSASAFLHQINHSRGQERRHDVSRSSILDDCRKDLAAGKRLQLVSPSFDASLLVDRKQHHRVTATRTTLLFASPKNTETPATSDNPFYAMLATGNDEKPGGGNNFFYNDEVVSHLHGYMLLVGLFAAQDEVFLISFLFFASSAAFATYQGKLPANPRVPAIVAAATLAVTVVCRYGVGYEPTIVANGSSGPAAEESSSAILFEFLVCALNISWGFAGSWRTKEKVNGGTFGF